MSPLTILFDPVSVLISVLITLNNELLHHPTFHPVYCLDSKAQPRYSLYVEVDVSAALLVSTSARLLDLDIGRIVFVTPASFQGE